MDVMGYNIVSESTFDNITNVKRYKGMTQGEYMKTQYKNKEGNMVYHTYSDFVDSVQGVMSRNKSIIEKLTEAPLGGILRTVEASNQSSVLQVVDSIDQWKLAKNIVNGTGKLVGWDLETVGDITSGNDSIAGITEFGIAEKIYKDGKLVPQVPDRPQGYALAIGFSKDQAEELRGLVRQFKTEGWDSLADPKQIAGALSAKQSTLLRLSMIGSIKDKDGHLIPANSYDRVYKTKVHFFNDKEFYVWSELGPANFNPDLMMKGIDIGAGIYKNGATPENVLPYAINYITEVANSKVNALHGANVGFDSKALGNEARKFGIDVDEHLLYSNTVDIVYGTRKIADSKAQSVNTYSESLHKGTPTNINAAASVESQAEVAQMGKKQTHFSVEDIINEGDILTMQYYDGKLSYIDTVINSEVKMTPYTIKDTVFLINRGSVQNDSSDLVVIGDNNSMQTYPLSNEYWTIGTHSGYAQLEDGYGEVKEKYVLEFINGVDENVKIYKSFDSMESAGAYLLKNTTPISSSKITSTQIEEQFLMSVRDIGRREFDRLFDVKSVRVNDGVDDGGFASMQKYLQLAKDLETLPEFKDKTLDINLISNIRKHQAALPKDERTLKSEYQVQAFAGMYEKLIDEKLVLNNIVENVSNKNTNNATKTAMTSRARSAVLESIDNSKYNAIVSQDSMYALTDVFGIDIQINDAIKRVNASSVDAAIPGVRSVFKDLDLKQAKAVITDLHQRGVIDDRTKSDLFHSAEINIRPSVSNNNFITDVAHKLVNIMSPINNASNPLDLFSQIKSTNRIKTTLDTVVQSNGPTSYSIDEALQHLDPNQYIHEQMPYYPSQILAIRNKNLQSISGNLYGKSRSQYTAGNERLNLSEIYTNENLGSVIEDAIRQTNELPIDYYTDFDAFSAKLSGLQSKLGYTDSEFEIVTQMFNADKPYAINKYTKKGLQSFVISPENSKNAYILLTNKKHSNALQDLLFDKSFDSGSLRGFNDIKERFGQHAFIFELHSVNRNVIPGESFGTDGIAKVMGQNNPTLITVNQNNNFEKFLNPVLDIYTYNGQVQGEIKSGATELLTAYRISGKSIINKILNEDDFEGATTIARNKQNRKFRDLSAPSSYRGVKVGDTVKRVANYHPADILQAYEFNVKGLRSLLDIFVNSDEDNSIKTMLDVFNQQYGVVNTTPGKQLTTSQYRSIANSSTFNEFYVRSLFTGSIAKELGIESSNFDKSIFGLLQDSVRDDVSGLFNESVSNALNSFSETVAYINQVLPQSGIEHNLISYMKPGAFNVSAGLFSTLRPTYTQQNRALYFSLSKDSNIAKLLESNGYTHIGQTSMTELEYSVKKIPGLSSPDLHRSISTRFRQMSDAELQLQYEKIKGLTTKLAKNDKYKFNGQRLDTKKLKTVIEYMRTDMGSFNEGKWFYDPLLGNQDFFRTPDAKKITLFDDKSSIDEKATRDILHKLQQNQTTITAGDVIGKSKSGNVIYYKGPAAIMQDYNVSELLENGETYIIPKEASVSDIKLMIGSEKAMAHTIEADKLVAYMSSKGINATTEEAIHYSHIVFQKMFDATVAGNIASYKHNNNYATDSIWNTVVNEYVRAGKSRELNDMLHGNELGSYFADWNIKLHDDGQITVNNTESKNLTSAIEQLEYFIREHGDRIGDKKTNKKIVSSLNYQKKHGLITASVERVHLNEHLSDMFKIDQRIEQGIRFRTQALNASDIDDKYMNAIREYAMSEDLGKSSSFMSDNFGAIQKVTDVYNYGRARDTRHYNTAVKNNRRNVKGIQETLEFFNNPSEFDVSQKNIININMSDLLGDHKVPKGGISVSDLEKFLFYIDGKPSSWLEELGKKQNINFDADIHSLYISLDNTIRYKGKEINGVLIPIQNMVTNIQDEQFFTESQRITTRFLNDIIELTKTSNKPDSKKTWESVIDSYRKDLKKQTAIMDKDSDMYKAYGRFALSNAGQYQAIDETPALIDSMLNKKGDIVTKTKRLQALKKEISTKSFNEVQNEIKEYDTITKELKEAFKKAADSVRNADTNLPELSALKTSPFKDLSIMEIDGKQYYNNLVAIGEEGFKARGYDFGQVGMDLVFAHFSNDYSNIPQIANKKGFKVTDKEIDTVVKRLKELGFEDIDRENLLVSLNAEFDKKYYNGSFAEMLDTTKVNNAIVNGDLQKIFGTFSDIGKRYTREVGVLAEQLRYPSFGIQPMVNVILDDSIKGRGIRFFNPAMSTWTNVDFDGDTAFLALHLSGGSFAKLSDDRIKYGLEVHKRTVQFNNELVARLIESGEAFKVDDLNDYQGVTANMLRSFKEKEYIDAVSSWAKNNKIDFKSINDLTKGQILSAEHSIEMGQAWRAAQLNTLLDENIIRASLATATRKENIGAISTPNFTLRATIDTLSKDTSFTQEQRNEFLSILQDMFNPNDKYRGMTGIVEQKGIDVKHVIDAFGLAETPKWSMGLSQMFSQFGGNDNKRAEGLANMITASRSVLFKDSTESTEEIVADILAHDRAYFTSRTAEDEFALAKRYLRGVYDIASNEKAVAIYNSSIKRGTWEDNYRTLQALGIYDNTIEANFIEGLERYQSDARILLDADTVYIKTGSVSDELKKTGWMLDSIKDGTVSIKQVSLEDGNTLEPTGRVERFGTKGKTNIEINEEINNFFRGHQKELQASAFSVRESEHVRDTLFSNGEKQSRIDILNDLVLTEKDSIRPYDAEIFKKIKSAQLASEAYYQDINRWFSLENVDGQKKIYDDIEEISKVYQYAIDTHMVRDRESIGLLIKNINSDIVNNPEKYAQSTEFTNFSDLLQKRVSETLGSGVYERAHAKMQGVGNLFSHEKYNESLAFLNKELYDIINEESRLKESFDSVRANLDSIDMNKVDASKVKPMQDILASSDNVTRQTLNSLRARNEATIKKVQDDIYSLFENTSNMNAHFEWDKVSGTSMVGFGQHIGTQFRELTDKEIDTILSDIKSISQTSRDSMSAMQRHAIEQTEKSLITYKKNGVKFTGAPARRFNTSQEVDKIITSNKATILSMYESFGAVENVVKPPRMQTNKTLGNAFMDNAKEALSKIPMKTVGIAAASLAALGIANNILHRNKSQSPLTPARKQDGTGDVPSTTSPASTQQAPMSKQRTIYHDNGSGFNFKVSAKTNKYISDRNNAKLISMSGGGKSSVYTQSDTSGVTDNWLENKFAELV